jgi:hypothetical protein
LNDGGRGIGGDVITETSQAIHINHTDLCWAIQTHPSQLSKQPIRFVSDSYATKHLWDSGVFFNNCHLRNQSLEKNPSHRPHHPVHLIVNEETRPIVDDPLLYYECLTNENLQRRYSEEDGVVLDSTACISSNPMVRKVVGSGNDMNVGVCPISIGQDLNVLQQSPPIDRSVSQRIFAFFRTLSV